MTLDQTIASLPEPSLLIRERFEEVNGGATLVEGGLVATYAGTWLGDSNACGVNLYSTGTHHIRFRILE